MAGTGFAAITRKVNRFGRLFSLGRGDRVVIVLVSKTSGLCASRVRIPSAAPFTEPEGLEDVSLVFSTITCRARSGNYPYEACIA